MTSLATTTMRPDGAQAGRAVEVLVRRRATVLLGPARRGVVDERDAGGRRDAVAGAEDLRLVRGRERHGRAARYAAVRREAIAAEVVEHAEAAVGVGVGHRDRLRDVGEPIAGLHEVLIGRDAVGVDDGLRLRLYDSCVRVQAIIQVDPHMPCTVEYKTKTGAGIFL